VQHRGGSYLWLRSPDGKNISERGAVAEVIVPDDDEILAKAIELHEKGAPGTWMGQMGDMPAYYRPREEVKITMAPVFGAGETTHNNYTQEAYFSVGVLCVWHSGVTFDDKGDPTHQPDDGKNLVQSQGKVAQAKSQDLSQGSASPNRVTLRRNEELDGIEVVFADKPDRSSPDLAFLKSHKFRFHGKRLLWYKKFDESLMEELVLYFKTRPSAQEPEKKPEPVLKHAEKVEPKAEPAKPQKPEGLEIKECDGEWFVLHLKSNHVVSPAMATNEEAESLMESIYPIADWTLDAQSLLGSAPNLQDEIAKAHKMLGQEAIPAPEVVSIPVEDMPELQPPSDDKPTPIEEKMDPIARAKRALSLLTGD